MLRISHDEFSEIVEGLRMQRIHEKLFDYPYSMTMENKLLLVMLFVIRYPSGVDLGIQFNVSGSYVSSIIDEMLPHCVEFFSKFVPNKNRSDTHSVLHQYVKYIMDDTVHKIRKPVVYQ